MIKKIILIILLLPVMGWSQPTTFSDEEHKFARSVAEKMLNNPSISSDEVYLELDIAMQKVPYHPGLVQYLLTEKFNSKDYEFVYNYCKKLDDHYLSTFQPILVEICGKTYCYKEDYDGLYNRIIPLIKDENIKGLYLALYYKDKGNEAEFIKHAKYSILGNYKYDFLNYLRDYHLYEYYRIISNKKNTSLLESFLKDYEQVIFLSNFNVVFYLSLIEDATHTLNDELAIKLINYVKELDVEKYKSLYPAIAYYYSFKGEEEVALEALNKAFEIDKSVFLKSYNPDDTQLIFNTYSVSISKLSDFKTKERMIEKGMHYFEDILEYKIMFKLYQSMLSATKDITAAKAILKECEPYLNEINYDNLNNILIINNEMSKKKPDYRMVDGLLDKVVAAIDFNPYYYQKIMYRYKVNYSTKKQVFTLNEVVEGFDKIFSKPLSKADELYYLRPKLLFIGESDKEWLMREVEKLPTDIADELIESFNIAENNPEKTAEILSTNKMSLQDVNRTVDFINISYLNTIILKK